MNACGILALSSVLLLRALALAGAATGDKVSVSASLAIPGIKEVVAADGTKSLVGATVGLKDFLAVDAQTDAVSVSRVAGTTETCALGVFTFTESLVPPVNGLYNVYADISGSLVNGVAGSALHLGTTVGSTLQKVFLKESAYGGSFSAGVDVGNAFLNASAPAGSIPYIGNGLQSATANGTSGAYTYDAWEFRTDFSLTGNKDVATLSGYAEISPIPEPQTYALFIAGLLAVIVMLRRRSQD